MSFWPSSWTPSPAAALLVLMVVGHVLADFLIQTREDVRAKSRGVGYLAHGGQVLVTHLLVVVPMMSLGVAGVLAAIAALHTLIDWAKGTWIPDRWGRLKPFLLDQSAHLLTIVVGWRVLVGAEAVPAFRWLSVQQVGIYLTSALLAAAFAFNATGGSVVVEAVLGILPHDEEDDPRPAGYEGAGRLIGILERTLMLPLVLFQEWSAIALLIAAKSIARFEEIKVRKFAEYYLVGTLASLLVALAIGLVLTGVVFPLAE